MAPQLEPAEIFEGVVQALLMGVVRLFRARIVRSLVFIEHVSNQVEPRLDETARSPQQTSRPRVSPSELDGFLYVTDLSQLVYVTSLFDTLVTDTTRFLLLYRPEALGNKKTVAWDDVLNAPSRASIVTGKVNREVWELGHLSFLDRLQYLKEKFGLDVVPTGTLMESLDHFSSIRNTLVHDQGVLDLSLDDDGRLVAAQRRCWQHPTPVATDDLGRAVSTYLELSRRLYSEVTTRILGSSVTETVSQTLAVFQNALLAVKQDQQENLNIELKPGPAN
jgi:hypothetical protein